MRAIILTLIILTITSLSFSQTLYYKSNSAGIQLGEVSSISDSEYTISEEINSDSNISEKIYYKNSVVIKTVRSQFSSNFSQLLEVITTEGVSRIVDNYTNGNLTIKEVYNNDILESKVEYSYNDNNIVNKAVTYDSENRVLFTELYYTRKNGELRRVERIGGTDYYINWFYTNGKIVESWESEDNIQTRTLYNELGAITQTTQYINEIVIFTETNNYNSSGLLLSKDRIEGDKETVTQYNRSQQKAQEKIYNNGILSKQKDYKYSGEYLDEILTTGHGKKELEVFSRNSNGELLESNLYINGVLDSQIVYRNSKEENSRINSYYRDGVIFLKEYYRDEEKIKRELFLNGDLYKSEILSE